MNKITLLFFTVLISFCSHAQLAEEGFEGTFPPPGWAVINVAGPNFTWSLNDPNNDLQPAYEGQYAAYLQRENVATGTSEDWLITTQFTVPPFPELHFYSRLTIPGNQNTIYQVRISDNADQLLQGEYEIIQTWTETQINPSQEEYFEKVVSIPASYIGQTAYIAFVMLGDNGDRWLIDNVSVIEQCQTPVAQISTGVTENSALLNWTNPGNETNWEIELIEATAAFTGTPNITYNGLPPYPASDLTPATGYKYKVRAVCDPGHESEWSNTINFTTLFEPPVNDNCINAIALTINPTNICTASTPGTVNAATASPEPSTCTGTEDDDVWYTFTATNTTHLINLNNVTGSTTDLVHVLYSGTGCGSLTQMYCSDPNNSTATGLTVGNTYFVRVYSWSSASQTTSFNICIGTPPPPPANDECANATAAPVNPDLNCGAFVTGTIYSATESPQANTCTGTDDDDVWYTFVATNTEHTINLNNITGSTTNLNHVVYSGSCGTLTQLYCSDPNNSIAGGLTVGNTYTIRIYSSVATAQTSVFDLCIGTPPPPPVNDQCSGAISAPVNPDLNCAQTVPGTIAWATPSSEGGTACTGTEDDDIWYTFTATNTSHTININNITGGTTDLVHAVYSGTCAGFTQLYCSDPNNSIAGGLVPGETYYLRIYSWTATSGQTSTFDVCIGTPPPPPANDECSAAIVAPVNADLSCAQTVPGTIAWSTPSIESSTCLGTEDDDVWYVFTATNPVHTINLNNVAGSTTDLVHAFYSGNNCGALTQMYCSDPNNSIAQGLVVGQTYYIRIYSWSSTGGQTTTFDVCIGTPPPPPANDECATAVSVPVNTDLSCAQSVAGTIAWATASADGGTACAGTEDDDVWYTFVATNPIHTIDFTNVTGSTTDLNHVLYSGNVCGSLTQLYCAAPNNSIASGLTVGETYTVRVYSATATAGQTTTFNICIGTPPPPPANDDCAAAVVVPVNPTHICDLTTPGTIAWSTPSPESSTCTGTEDDDVWFEFTATNTTHLISLLNVTGSTTDLVHVLYSGDQCGTLTQLYCSDPNNSTATGLVVGQVYKVRVYSWTATAGQTTAFNICIGTPPPPPANDECAAAIPVPVNPTMECVQTVPGIIYSATASPEGNTCAGTADDDVWFEFVATNTTHIVTLDNITGSTTNLFHVIYAGDQCGSLTQLLCSDPNSSIIQNLTVGETYKVRVYSNVATPQTSEFTICVSTPPAPGPNDECADAIVVGVNQNSSCNITASGTVFGATASAEANSCGGTDDDDVWFEFVATHTTHLISLTNVQGSTTDLFHVLYQGNQCGSLTQLYCSDANSSEATGLVIGNTYKIRVYSWTSAAPQTTTFDVCIRIPNTPITVSETQYTVEQLVTEVLIDSDCAIVSNITWSTGTNFGAANGIGFFDAAASDFPFQNGVILATGSIQEAIGGSAGTATGWPGDPELLAITQEFDPQTTVMQNASIIEFDFVPLTNQFTFDFLFASNEYGTFQCGYSDAFAFILTGPSPSTDTQNLAVIPGTDIPVLVTTIRDNANNGGCPSANIEYFGQYNANDPQAAAIDYNGQTVPMQASADVIPGELYHIKLVIADSRDSSFNAAVFLGGGSFDIGDIDLGGDLLLSQGTALCDDETITLDTGLEAANFTFVWQKDGEVIPTATGPSLTVTEPGVYNVVASFPNIACSYEGEVTIEFFPDIEEVTGDPSDLTYCDASGFHTFDLTVNTDVILAPLPNPDIYTVDYYLSEADALADENPIINFTNFTNTVPGIQTIYVRILNQAGGCLGIKTFDLIIEDLTPQFDVPDNISLCGDEIATITVTPINFDPASPDVGIVWTYNGTTLPDTGISINTLGEGTYEVTINNKECTATAAINVTSSSTPVASITYPGTPYCSNAGTATVMQTGNTGGVYSGTEGLVIDPATGDINLSASTGGDHIVSYTIAANGSCPELVVTANITITTLPEAVFTYDSVTFCQNEQSPIIPSFNGAAAAGTFTANGPLTIDPATGIITAATSQEGTYTVTNTIDAANGCPAVIHTVTITILEAPVGTFSYGAASYCQEDTSTPMPIMDTDAVAGTFSASPAGLSINPATGEINLAASEAGIYTVFNTVAATAECPEVVSQFEVIISATPVFTIVEGCNNNLYALEVVPVDGSFDPDFANIAWSGGAFTGSGAVIQPSETGEFTVTVTSGDCIFTDSFTVNSTTCFIQRGISPGDGQKNDTFDLSALNVTKLSIFNRYGQEVFSYGNYTNQWSGQDNSGNELPTGTYYYSIERANGETKTGWVYINRQN